MSRPLMAGSIRLCDFNLCWNCFCVFKASPALKRVFCSIKCAGAYFSRANVGRDNPNWRGGIHSIQKRDGRSTVYESPEQPAVYVYREIAARKIGRRLTRRDVVHHINGDPMDNRPENLEVMTQSRHATIEMRRRYSAAGYGVGWCKRSSKWRARIKTAGKEKHLGLFEEKFDAVQAVLFAREVFWQ